jgi:endonuclease-3 related protein
MLHRRALREAHRRLGERLGPLDWWPGETPFEVMVGAVLTQNTAWRRVEPAIANLKSAGVLDPARLSALDPARLEDLIRPAGTFRVKARYLRGLVDWLVEEYDGDVGRALDGDTHRKREELLALRGVGRETADSILLYAGGHPIFVVDAYTRRIFSRHGLLDPTEDYDAIREWFEERLPEDPAVLNELHAQIVIVGKDWCRPRSPRCSSCPLEFLFEETGTARPDGAK